MIKRKKKPALFKFSPFSMKQKKVLTWWVHGKSPYKDKDGIICDGSVRAGKTVVMSLPYGLWKALTMKTWAWPVKRLDHSDVMFSSLCRRCYVAVSIKSKNIVQKTCLPLRRMVRQITSITLVVKMKPHKILSKGLHSPECSLMKWRVCIYTLYIS